MRSGETAARIVASGETIVLECFTFYKSYFNIIEKCNKKAQLEMYKAIANYAIFGEEPKQISNRMGKALWESIFPNLRRNRTNALNRKGTKKEPKVNQK